MSKQPLGSTPVFFLDCQATGTRSRGGWLVEMAWCRSSQPSQGLGLNEIESHLVCLPDGMECPRGLERVTGIRSEDLSEGVSLDFLARRFREDLTRSIQAGFTDPPLLVIHYARFEEPFLTDLLELRPLWPRPFEIICTHEISRRLLAFLPRRGLRAVAGYFGHATPRLRRATDHVRASAVIWRGLIPLLAEQGVQSLSALRRWLLHRTVPRKPERKYPLKASLRLSLPDQPGVYRLLRSNGDVLYVGKATSLKRRVNSYFQKRWKGQERTLELLSQVRNVEVSPTETSLEAALLEVSQIQQFTPPYNVALRSERRELFFLDETLQLSPDGGRTGPVVLPRTSPLLQLLPLLRRLLTDSRAPADFPTWVRDQDTWDQGVADFCSFRLRPFVHLSAAGCLRALANHLEELEAESLEEESRLEAADPASVVRTLDRAALWATRSMARARWLSRLSGETVIHWPSPGAGLQIVIQRGEISLRSEADRETPEPVEGGGEMAWSVSLYDRLRVLTSEMKRGLRQERLITVSLGGRARLQGQALEQALKWV